MASLLEQLPQIGIRQDIPQSFLNVFQELYHDGRLTSWKVRGEGDILSIRLTWVDSDERNSCIKAKARQHLGEINVIEISLVFLVDLDDDLGYGTFPTNETKDSGWFSYANSHISNTICKRIFIELI